MWLFLASEVLFFAGLVSTYLVLRISNPEAFRSTHLQAIHGSAPDLLLASLGTFVLLASSVTMALAVRTSVAGQSRKTTGLLLLTAILGILFCGIQWVEYDAQFRQRIGPDTSIFYSCFFTLTAVHLLHVFLGIVPLLGVALLNEVNHHLVGTDATSVGGVGLYWHFVGIVWILLFSLLYLST